MDFFDRPNKQERGFTLIELMVVILLSAIASSMVVISIGSIGSDKKQLDSTAKSIIAQMQFAMDEALVNQYFIGLKTEVDEGGYITAYHWHIYQDEKWQRMEEPLKSQSLPETVSGQIIMEDQLLEDLMEKSLNSLADENELPPSIIFYPNYEISDFELTLWLKEETEEKITITLDERGELIKKNEEV